MISRMVSHEAVQRPKCFSSAHPVSPQLCWVSPPSAPHSWYEEPDYSSSLTATPIRTTWQHDQHIHHVQHRSPFTLKLAPTLKCSSIRKSQPIKSKKPSWQRNLDLTASKQCVMICCICFWCMKGKASSQSAIQNP